MTVEKIMDYAVCQDCFDYHMGWTDSLELADIDRCKKGFLREMKPHYKEENYPTGIIYWQEGSDAEDQEFARQPCEVCGTSMGGKRLTLTLMRRNAL